MGRKRLGQRPQAAQAPRQRRARRRRRSASQAHHAHGCGRVAQGPLRARPVGQGSHACVVRVRTDAERAALRTVAALEAGVPKKAEQPEVYKAAEELAALYTRRRNNVCFVIIGGECARHIVPCRLSFSHFAPSGFDSRTPRTNSGVHPSTSLRPLRAALPLRALGPSARLAIRAPSCLASTGIPQASLRCVRADGRRARANHSRGERGANCPRGVKPVPGVAHRPPWHAQACMLSSTATAAEHSVAVPSKKVGCRPQSTI